MKVIKLSQLRVRDANDDVPAASEIFSPYVRESTGLDRTPTDYDITSPNNYQWPLSDRLLNRVC